MKTNALKGSFVRGALLGGLLGVFSSSLSAQEKLPVENDLKIISYNIRHGEGLDGKTDYVRIARMFREQQADVVALQEVDSVTGRSHKKDVLREIANEALMYPVFAKAISFDGGSYGVGLLAREHPLSVERIALPGREEARVLLLAEFDDYYIGCTHLSLTPEDQLASLDVIRKIASRLNKPFLLAGDWNALPESQTIQEIRKDLTLLNNLKQAAKTMNFLTEHGISSYGELESKLTAVSARRDTAHAEIKRIESRSAELTLVMKHAGTYRQLKPLYERYRKSNDKEKFLRGHESEIILFEAAARELKRLGAVPLPTTESMKTELANLNAEKERLLAEYKAARAEAQEYETVKQNVDALLTVAKEQEQQRRHELE